MKNHLVLRVFLTFTVTAFLVSCSTSKRIDKWVGKHYGETVPTKIKSADYITFSVRDSIGNGKVSSTRKTNSQVIPALLYWQWKSENSATLNVMLPMNSFVSGFLAQTNAKNLKQKLNGGHLNIMVGENPGNFRLQDRGWIVYLILAYVGSSKIYVEPSNISYSVDYSFVSAAGETRSGTVTVSNPNKERVPRFFQSLKGAIGEYLTLSDSHVSSIAKELADKMMIELAADGLVTLDKGNR